MVNSWIQATKLYNDKNNSSGVPKKGTEAYDVVKRIQDELKKRVLAEDPPTIKPVAEKPVIKEPVIKPKKDPKPKKLQEIVEDPPKQTRVSKKNAFKPI